MRILVVSDSHGDVDALNAAVRRESPDSILHLGDLLRDARAMDAGGAPLLCVPGNCDWGAKEPAILTPELAGKRFYMTHGHLHGVKTQYMRILYAALEAQADVLVFGHTHRPECFFQRGIWVLNPGPCNAWGSYGLVDIQGTEITCCVKSVNT